MRRSGIIVTGIYTIAFIGTRRSAGTIVGRTEFDRYISRADFQWFARNVCYAEAKRKCHNERQDNDKQTFPFCLCHIVKTLHIFFKVEVIIRQNQPFITIHLYCKLFQRACQYPIKKTARYFRCGLWTKRSMLKRRRRLYNAQCAVRSSQFAVTVGRFVITLQAFGCKSPK